MPEQVGLEAERIEGNPNGSQAPVRPLTEPVPIDIFMFSLSQVSAEFRKWGVGNVEVTPPLGEAYRIHINLFVKLEPIIYRGAP
jgi:hypothetical protein